MAYIVFYPPFNLFPDPPTAIKISLAERANVKPDQEVTAQLATSKTVTLPDNWFREGLAEPTQWYRAEFTIEASQEREYAIYVPTIRQNIDVYLNGVWIGEGSPTNVDDARLWNHPQFFEFDPQHLVAAGRPNSLVVAIKSRNLEEGYLSAIFVGTKSALYPSYEWRQFFKVDLMTLLADFMLLVGFINLALWVMRRQDTYYLWYALVAIAWGARGYLTVIPSLGIDEETWAALRLWIFGCGVAFTLQFNIRFFSQKSGVLDWIVVFYCFPLALPMFFLSGDAMTIYSSYFWIRLCVPFAIYISWKLIMAYIKDNNTQALMFLYSGFPLTLYGVRDLLVLNGWIDPANGFLTNYATPPALILAMWFIVQRYSNALSREEELSRSLDKQVKDKERELKDQYDRQSNLERKQVLSEERERIMRDMHDGMGGHLVSLKSIIDSDQPDRGLIKETTERALTDLRFVIQSMNQEAQSLDELLATFRRRWRKVLERNGMTFSWEHPNAGSELELRPTQQLHLLRILEEALANVVKHSEANLVSVLIVATNNQLNINVRNDQPRNEKQTAGFGLENMQIRAQKMGAALEILQSEQHFEVAISLKL